MHAPSPPGACGELECPAASHPRSLGCHRWEDVYGKFILRAFDAASGCFPSEPTPAAVPGLGFPG